MLQEEQMRTLTGKAIEKFYKEFPFMETIIDRESAEDTEHFKIKLQVSVADAESLYTIPKFCLPPHWIGTHNGKYVGRVRPLAYAFDSGGRLLETLEWNYDHPSHFLKDVVTNESTDVVVLARKYSWWHEIEDWFEQGLDTYVGKYSHREYQIFVFKKTEQGFAKLIEESDLTKNVPINDLISISLAGHRAENEATRAIEVLEALVDEFENSIGIDLWKQVNECSRSGMSGTFGKTELRTFASAGRIMLSFWVGKNQITFVGDESDYTRTGLQSMNCSVDMAKLIVQEVIDNWPTSKLEPDNQVNMI
jgi:hypothetical protein